MGRKYTILLVLSWFSLFGYCENYKSAVLYLNNGDSITGLISYTEHLGNDKLSYKKSDGYLERVYNLHEVTGFLFIHTGQKYIRETIRVNGLDKSVFVEEVVKSKMSLYALHVDAETKFYLKKKGNFRLIDLPVSRLPETVYNGYAIKSYNSYTTNHKDTLRKYMNDAVDIEKEIDKIAFPEQNSLISLIKEYNRQFGEKSITAQQLKIKTINFEFKISPAMCFSTAGVNRLSNNFTIYYGGLLDISPYFAKHQLSITSGLFLATFKYANNTDGQNIYQANIFKIPLFVKYQYNSKFIRPVASVGVNSYYSDVYGSSVMPAIQIGADVYLSKRLSIKLTPEFEFQMINSITPIRYRVFNVLMGVTYRL